MKERRLDSVKNEFIDIYTAIRNLSHDEILNGPDDGFRPHFERLHGLAAMDVDDHEAAGILHDRDFQSAAMHICQLKALYGLRLEIDAARSIIKGPDPWAMARRFAFYPNYLQLAHMEYTGANLKSRDRVVFLGSGPFPLTLICLCAKYGIEGVGIEHVPEYAELSENLVKCLDLSGHIRILCGNHFSLPLSEKCQLVMIGADARPKDEIFAHLAKALPGGTRLSRRIYEKGLRRLLDDHALSDLPPGFTEYARIRPEPPVNNTSVFLIRNTEY